MAVQFRNLEPHQELYRRNARIGTISLSIYNALRLEYGLSAIEAHHLAMLFAGVTWLQDAPKEEKITCDNCRRPMVNTRKHHGLKASYHICPRCLVENED